MNSLIATFFRSYTFQRQLGITVTIGILLLAMLSSLVGSWQSNERARRNILDQGQLITENLARQSALALIYGSADNAAEAAKATMSFPSVVRVEILDAKQRILLVRGSTAPVKLAMPSVFADMISSSDGAPTKAIVDAKNPNAWRFMTPVYSQPAAESPYDDQASVPELLGYVTVVISKAALTQATSELFITNLATSFSFALLFLLIIRVLTNRMTRPLSQLSASMGRAEAGESHVRARPDGPRDIAAMSHAFNNMMSVLEERESALHIAATAFETSEGMMVTDENVVIIRVNQSFTRLTGYSAEEAIGKTPAMLQSGRQNAAFYQHLWQSLQRDHHWQGEIWNRRKNGEIYPEWLNISAVFGTNGQVTHYVGSFSDITQRKQAEEEIYSLAFYDSLSQLPNRRLLLDRLKQAVSTSTRNQTSGALLFLDLDNFKTLNDTKGHAIGDLLLIEVAKRLHGCVREGDTLSRFGGDEFVVLLEGLSKEKAQAAVQARGVGEKVLQAINRPYLLDGYAYHCSSSIGVTLFIDYKQKLDELLKQADTAMYEAKKSGRNALRFFDPAMQEELETRTQLEMEMRDALLREEFKLYYQMQIDHAGQILGAEVLLRWLHPQQGMISPLQFIPLAEETGFILPLGQWVLDQACQQIKAWESDLITRKLQLAVNVSGRQFHQIDFVSQVREILDRTGIDPSRLKLELTESMVLDDIADTVVKMQALKKIGVRFSMDDFGTGYSSLSYLTRLPLDQLKIDQSFVRNLGTKPTDAVIVQTIIGMANNLGMEVIAEGVETQAQCDFLGGAGCSLYQGYLFGKPVPLDEFEARLDRQ